MAALGPAFPTPADRRRRAFNVTALACLAGALSSVRAQSPQDTIERVKRSIVAVGTFQHARAPQFQFRGTGFAVSDGYLVATSAHLLPDGSLPEGESLAIALPMTAGSSTQIRNATVAALDRGRDLAVLRFTGAPLPALAVGGAEEVREGDALLVTGFPLGTILGTYPVTHRASIAAITPIAIPPASARQLDAARLRQLQAGAFPIFQLDATIYPGNSGSPVYEPLTGRVVGVANMALVRALKEGELPQPSGIAYAIPGRHLEALLAGLR